MAQPVSFNIVGGAAPIKVMDGSVRSTIRVVGGYSIVYFSESATAPYKNLFPLAPNQQLPMDNANDVYAHSVDGDAVVAVWQDG